jgi:Zn-dependent peptidase ImmA (M78 family)
MAIEEAIRAAFPDLPELKPPIQLGRLAARRGVTDVLKRNLKYDGMISATSQGAYVIQVNGSQSESRRRFTIAHELGHTFFFDVDPDIRQRVRDGNLDQVSRFDPEELLCNYAAAEILMPRHQFGKMLREAGPSSEVLPRLGKVFGVSLQAATRRLLQLVPRKLVVAQWEYKPSEGFYVSNWIAGLSIGKATNRRNLIVRDDDPAFKIFHDRSAFRGPVWISLDGPLDDYFVDLVSWRSEGVRRVLTMFVLERNPERIFIDRRVKLTGVEQMSLF